MCIRDSPAKDKVLYKGKVISPEKKKVYIMLNKPEGYVTTAKDQFGSCLLYTSRCV